MLFFVPAVDAPSIGPLDFFFNVRSRYEQTNDVFFNSSADQNRTLLDTRARLGFDYDAGDDTRVRVTYQFSNVQIDDEQAPISPSPQSPHFQFNVGVDFRGETRQDFSEAFVEHKAGDSVFTVGRQHVDKGVGKLVGSNDWGEVARSWNGARVQAGNWDVFAGRLDLDRVNNGREMLYYAGYTWGYGGESTVTYKHDPDVGDSIYMIDHLWRKEMSDNFFLGFQGAIQWGRDGGNDLEAWAATLHGQYAVSDRVGLFAQYSTASGGGTLGRSRTFDDMYPSDHSHYGIMDLQAWRNVNAISVGLDYDVNDKIDVGVAYHDFTLFDEDDFWYNGSNGFQYGYGNVGSDDVGNEIDFKLNWRVQNSLTVNAGFAVFDPGAMVAASGGGTDTQTWFYAGLGWRY